MWTRFKSWDKDNKLALVYTLDYCRCSNLFNACTKFELMFHIFCLLQSLKTLELDLVLLLHLGKGGRRRIQGWCKIGRWRSLGWSPHRCTEASNPAIFLFIIVSHRKRLFPIYPLVIYVILPLDIWTSATVYKMFAFKSPHQWHECGDGLTDTKTMAMPTFQLLLQSQKSVIYLKFPELLILGKDQTQLNK
jgi:hypothetical protein